MRSVCMTLCCQKKYYYYYYYYYIKQQPTDTSQGQGKKIIDQTFLS